MITPTSQTILNLPVPPEVRNRTYGNHEARTTGTMPVWGQAVSAKDQIQKNLSAATYASHSQSQTNSNFSHALIAQKEHVDAPPSPSSNQEDFGFLDLVDMINPLQHIPLIGTIYRELSGDEIKPASRIIGGALFGGGLGAAGALANVVIEAETGGNIAQNAFAMIRGEKLTPPKHTHQPEIQLAEAQNPDSGLPNALMSFSDLRHGEYNAEAPMAQ